MKQEPIIIKVSKEKQPTYQSNTHDFETLRYEEVGKPWWVNTKRELVEFLEKADQVLKSKVQVVVFNWQRFTNAFLVKKTARMVMFFLIAIKDILYVIYVLATSILFLGFQILVGGLQSPSRNTHQARTHSPTKPFQPPVDDEWWRRKSKPPASKKSRTIRVIVEVEDFES